MTAPPAHPGGAGPDSDANEKATPPAGDDAAGGQPAGDDAAGGEPAGDDAPGGEPAGDRGPARVALAVGVAAAASSLAQQFAASYALAASVGAFAVVTLVADRAGASWSSQTLGAKGRAALARAALFGLAPVLAVALAGWAAGALRFRPSAPDVGLAAAALRETFEAARHETLFRWTPWALARTRVPPVWLVAFQVLAGVAPLLVVAEPGAWAVAAAIGLLGASVLEQSHLWAAPVAAHAAMRLGASVLVPMFFDVRWPRGSWAPPEGARGAPALGLAAAISVAAAALLWAGGRRGTGRVSVTSRPRRPRRSRRRLPPTGRRAP